MNGNDVDDDVDDVSMKKIVFAALRRKVTCSLLLRVGK
jgi:hypothetical protein